VAPAVVLAGVFMPLRNRVVADMVGNLIEFETLLLFGLCRDLYCRYFCGFNWDSWTSFLKVLPHSM
jgi:hypothetical protein